MNVQHTEHCLGDSTQYVTSTKESYGKEGSHFSLVQHQNGIRKSSIHRTSLRYFISETFFYAVARAISKIKFRKPYFESSTKLELETITHTNFPKVFLRCTHTCSKNFLRLHRRNKLELLVDERRRQSTRHH